MRYVQNDIVLMNHISYNFGCLGHSCKTLNNIILIHIDNVSI